MKRFLMISNVLGYYRAENVLNNFVENFDK